MIQDAKINDPKRHHSQEHGDADSGFTDEDGIVEQQQQFDDRIQEVEPDPAGERHAPPEELDQFGD